MDERCSVSVLIPTKNEELNLRRCLDAIAGWADEIVIVDSKSTDSTLDIAAAYGATVIQFDYAGGWPKKRQWALDTFNWRNDWILLLDADEILLPEIKTEIAEAIQDPEYDGYWIEFQIYFLGRMLRHGGSHLWKLSLFRKGKGHYELRLKDQDHSMCDMEVHEHVVVQGRTCRLKQPVRHENLNTLDDYIAKHNAYSNWEAKLIYEGGHGELEPSLFGNQAQQRRFIKNKLLSLPGSPLGYFVLRYFIQLGFLDGVQGFIYSVFKGIQFFHVKAKVYEMKLATKPHHSAEVPQRDPEAVRQPSGAHPVHGFRHFRREPRVSTQANSAVDWHSLIAGKYDEKYVSKPRFIERYQLWTHLIKQYSRPDGHVFDVGCGTGILTFHAANFNRTVVGIDASTEMLDICERKKAESDLRNVTFLKTDVALLGEFRMERPDLIICSSILEYVAELDEILHLLISFLNRQGVLLVSMPNKSSLYRLIEPLVYGITGRPRYYRYVRNVLSLKTMVDKLQACGLNVLQTSYFSKAPILSGPLRRIGLEHHADLLYIVAAQKP